MFIIDRFEGAFAVIEGDKQTFNVPRSLLPKDAKEGDVIRVVIDRKATANRKQTAESLLDGFFDE